jgi:TetR/AcrR family transcriptional regulator, regulator of cefoperazone and chloramphenicol sensitivity
MRSTAAEDATTRSRIRDAAITLFARDGFVATSVRSIAEAAGVSPGLVIHHFGSKDKLRAECDATVVAELMQSKGGVDQGNLSASMQAMLSDLDQYRPTLDYLGRMLLDGSQAGDRLLDDLVTLTETMLEEGVADGTMKPTSDPRMRAVIVTLHGVMPIVLQRQFARMLDEPGLTATMIRRMTLPSLELYTHGLYADDSMLAAAREALGRSAQPRSDKGPGDPNQDPDPPVES